MTKKRRKCDANGTITDITKFGMTVKMDDGRILKSVDYFPKLYSPQVGDRVYVRDVSTPCDPDNLAIWNGVYDVS